MDQVRGFFRYFFDFHAAFGRGHEDHATGATVNNCAEVKFFTNVGRGFNQNLIYRLAMSVCLVSNQTFTQPVFSKSANVFFAVHNLHTARFTAATSVNLTFHYPRAGADF